MTSLHSGGTIGSLGTLIAGSAAAAAGVYSHSAELGGPPKLPILLGNSPYRGYRCVQRLGEESGVTHGTSNKTGEKRKAATSKLGRDAHTTHKFGRAASVSICSKLRGPTVQLSMHSLRAPAAPRHRQHGLAAAGGQRAGSHHTKHPLPGSPGRRQVRASCSSMLLSIYECRPAPPQQTGPAGGSPGPSPPALGRLVPLPQASAILKPGRQHPGARSLRPCWRGGLPPGCGVPPPG